MPRHDTGHKFAGTHGVRAVCYDGAGHAQVSIAFKQGAEGGSTYENSCRAQTAALKTESHAVPSAALC